MASPVSSSVSTPRSGTGSQTSYTGPFAIMTLLFFMWGFMTVWNDILIPRFKEAFTLSQFQANLVQSFFFGAYAVGSLIYYFISLKTGDPINRIGYKNGVILGLLIAAAGFAMFFPAAVLVSYPFFLLALFIVGLGFSMLQIAANPYVTILGPEQTASSRLNLSQAFNSIGTTIGPLVATKLVYTVFNNPNAHGASVAKIPYLCVGGIFVLLAVFFKLARVPNFTNTDQITQGTGALKYPHTALGMLAIFMYVGGEVTVGSTLINFFATPRLGSIPANIAGNLVALYWGGVMIGRFMGAFSLSTLERRTKTALVIAVPIVAFVIIALIPTLGWHSALSYAPFLVLLMVAFFAGGASAPRLLTIFGTIIVGLLIVSIITSGDLSKWTVLAVGLFCSVMWSNIFSLAIEGLGPLKSQASSLLIMAIFGGAVLPAIQGKIADLANIQISFVVPMIAFAYVAFYGIYGYRAGRRTMAGEVTDSVPVAVGSIEAA